MQSILESEDVDSLEALRVKYLGKKGELTGILRGVRSDGMLCSLKELGLTTHDCPEAEIYAAVLGDYHPLDPAKPSISPDIRPGDKIYGPVVAAAVTALQPAASGWTLTLDAGATPVTLTTRCSNLHTGDLVALDTKRSAVCELSDLRADQREFPHCIPTASSSCPATSAPATTSSRGRSPSPSA